MVPSIDSERDGLHYGDGHQLVEMLQSHGYRADRRVNASIAEVQERAGRQPVLLGFHRWGGAGHWVYCRGVAADGTLIVDNPAGTYDGIADRILGVFDRISPVTMVTIDLPEDVLSAAEREELERLREKVPGLITAVAYLADTIGDRVKDLPETRQPGADERQAIVDEMQRVREQFIGKRPGA